MMQTAETLAEKVGISTACRALAVPRSGLYRARKGSTKKSKVGPWTPPRALALPERRQVLSVLNSDRFLDLAPREVYATLLDEGTYLCSWRTMYRILAQQGQGRERRRGHQKRRYQKPELLATGPNQLWSWDITRLKGPRKWCYYYLYVIVDVFSRYVPGWLIAEIESAQLATELIETSCIRQNIAPDQLTLHSDRGAAMKAKSVAFLLADLGVTKTHSRPQVSNDNPFSEAQFKTLKYRPDFPDRFGALIDARVWAQPFFQWYNHQHHHSALGLLTPAVVHYGQAEIVRQQRQQVLKVAYNAHPERFVRGQSTPPALPQAVWINPPQKKEDHKGLLH